MYCIDELQMLLHKHLGNFSYSLLYDMNTCEQILGFFFFFLGGGGGDNLYCNSPQANV